MFWIGTQAAIEAANDAASGLVTSPNDPITTTWAVPRQAADGRWVIPAYAPMPLPEGCELIASVAWPETDE